MKNAYLAGYTDGDGSIFCRIYIQKPKLIRVYESSLQICSVDENICYFFKDNFTGSVHKRPEKRENRRPTWLWYVKGKNCLNALKNIEPFLIMKKKSSQLCCLLIENISNSFSYRNQKITQETHQIRESLIEQIKKEIHMNDKVDEEKFISFKKLSQSKNPTKADFAYFAGLIDAEGCFRIQHWKSKRAGRNESWAISLEIGNTKSTIFPWLIEHFGGTITYRKATTQRHNPMIIWSLRSDSLFKILNDVYPFLHVKKQRCEKLGQFHKTGLLVGGDRKSEKFHIQIMDILKTRKSLFDEFQILNAKGKH